MQPQTDDQSQQKPGWQYNPEQTGPTLDSHSQTDHKKTPQEAISWSASEFIAHQKNAGWYVLLALAGVCAAVIVFLLTRDRISTIMVAIVMVLLGVAASRKPRTLDYQLDNIGIHIGPKTYPYNDFKAFSVIDEGMVSSIELLPLKRFMPGISIYYDPNDEANITAILSAYLPFQEGQKDVFDRFMHRIRF